MTAVGRTANNKYGIEVTCGARESGEKAEILAEGDGLQVAESKVLRAAESHEHDSRRAADLPPRQQLQGQLALCAAWV